MTEADRFWSKVDRRGRDDCWEWQASRTEWGYGRFGVGGRRGRIERAHRVSWRMAFGPIPEELRVLHRCDNPPCVNPAHLFLGTLRDNTRDALRKGRLRPGRLEGPKNKSTRLTPQLVRTIRTRVSNRETQGVIAADLGLNQATVAKAAHGEDWVSRSHGWPSVYDRHPNARLTAAQLAEIRRRYVPRTNSALLAEEFGVTAKTIWAIAQGRGHCGVEIEDQVVRVPVKRQS